MVPALDEHGSAEKGHRSHAFYNQTVFSFYSDNVWTSHSIGITPLWSDPVHSLPWKYGLYMCIFFFPHFYAYGCVSF